MCRHFSHELDLSPWLHCIVLHLPFLPSKLTLSVFTQLKQLVLLTRKNYFWRRIPQHCEEWTPLGSFFGIWHTLLRMQMRRSIFFFLVLNRQAQLSHQSQKSTPSRNIHRARSRARAGFEECGSATREGIRPKISTASSWWNYCCIKSVISVHRPDFPCFFFGSRTRPSFLSHPFSCCAEGW